MPIRERQAEAIPNGERYDGGTSRLGASTGEAGPGEETTDQTKAETRVADAAARQPKGRTMASLCKEAGGRWAVLVMVPDADGGRKRRPRIRLGKMSKRNAERIQTHIEHLASDKASGQATNPDTAAWLGSIGDELHDRIARAGLVEPRQAQERATLGAFLTDYRKRPDVSEGTRVAWGQTMRSLNECFGPGKELASVTEGGAEDFKAFLVNKGLASATIARRVSYARQFFKMARKRGLVVSNPFIDVKATAHAPTERQRFIERATVARILEVCNPTWRLIVTLARYGGLRCPSEVLSLRLAGIDWERERVTIDSPKGKRDGKGTRLIPMFPELRDELQAAWDRAQPGEVYAVCGPDADVYRKAAQGPEGWRNANLRTQFERILTRAGVEAWPKLFQNLRASRETELAAEYPIHVVTAWLGNTPKVAMKHYLQVTDSDFQRAAKSGANSGAHPAHFPAQPVQAAIAHNRQEPTQTLAGKEDRPNSANSNQTWQPPISRPGRIRTCNQQIMSLLL